MGKDYSAASILRDVEVPATVISTPGSGHFLAFDFALDRVVVRLSAVAAGIQFHDDRIGARIKRAFADFNGARTRIDRSTQMAAIPFQFENDFGLPSRGRSPRALPLPSERIVRSAF